MYHGKSLYGFIIMDSCKMGVRGASGLKLLQFNKNSCFVHAISNHPHSKEYSKNA